MPLFPLIGPEDAKVVIKRWGWMTDYILFIEDPAEVVAFYRKALQVL